MPINSSKRLAETALLFCVLALAAWLLSATVSANGDDDHSAAAAQPAVAGSGGALTTLTAERNIQNDSGQFTIVLKRSPGNPRAGETEHFLAALSEKVQGGFGSDLLPLEKTTVLFSITRTDGSVIAENLSAEEEAGGLYRASHTFTEKGDFKIVISTSTQDNRAFSADFPITVSGAPVRTAFWIGLLLLI
ncbi:MAG: hypothetical protein H0X08_00260, partial [Blastocatellia bacterium]|nr:hypothetical protein [Blastocatellia bacterium]